MAMEKYYVFMRNDEGKEVFTRSWNLNSLGEWVRQHENKGYKLIEKNY